MAAAPQQAAASVQPTGDFPPAPVLPPEPADAEEAAMWHDGEIAMMNWRDNSCALDSTLLLLATARGVRQFVRDVRQLWAGRADPDAEIPSNLLCIEYMAAALVRGDQRMLNEARDLMFEYMRVHSEYKFCRGQSASPIDVLNALLMRRFERLDASLDPISQQAVGMLARHYFQLTSYVEHPCCGRRVERLAVWTLMQTAAEETVTELFHALSYEVHRCAATHDQLTDVATPVIFTAAPEVILVVTGSAIDRNNGVIPAAQTLDWVDHTTGDRRSNHYRLHGYIYQIRENHFVTVIRSNGFWCRLDPFEHNPIDRFAFYASPHNDTPVVPQGCVTMIVLYQKT